MFKKFADEGKDGEISRFYYAINKRDYNKTKKKLILELVDKDNASLVNINSLLVSCAMQKECAVTKKWLIDFDSRDPLKWIDFMKDLRDLVTIEQVYPTINGYGIITQRGFDTREFIEKYHDIISIHKDGYKLYTYFKKGLL
jgi:hypothetical protein